MKILVYILCFISLFCPKATAQKTKISIKALLITDKDQLAVQQKIVYINKSADSLENLVFHNWPKSFKDRNTPLSIRKLEGHSKAMYFADSIDLGNNTIHKVSANFKPVTYRDYNDKPDLLELLLDKKLAPKDSVIITINYKIKIPNSKFTGYGKNKNGDYLLRYWYLSPAVYENTTWAAYSNLDIDHMYMEVADYDLKVYCPPNYYTNTTLDTKVDYTKNLAIFEMQGNDRVDVQLNITKERSYSSFKTSHVKIRTNMDEASIPKSIKKDLLQREIDFIEKYLGRYPHDELLIDYDSYKRNPVYGLEKIPDFLNPFSDVFKWDVKVFKILSKKIIENTIITDKNKDYWLTEGIQIYLMMEYVNTYYPEAKLFGNLSKIWGLRTFNVTQLDFNEKYPFVYQFTARKNLDQSLTTQIDSLSNFNRMLVNSYKSGLGMRYLEQFLGDSIFKSSLKQFVVDNRLKTNIVANFEKEIAKNTDKDIKWFFGDYLHSKKKIDYTLEKVKRDKDSIYITVKNKRNITAPVALYGVKDKKIKWKKWLPKIDSTKTISVPTGDYDKVSLNYEFLYPELNMRDNWKNVKPKLFERPLQFKFLKDISDPYYNQIFFAPQAAYNYYDGVIFGIQFNNMSILQRNFEYSITPTYSFKSQNFSGAFHLKYSYYPENTSIYKFSIGASGSSYHYQEDYRYSTLRPSAKIYFNRKTLRTPGENFITVKYHIVDKEIEPGVEKSDEDKYNLLKISYNFNRPNIIHDLRFETSLEISNHFNKFTSDIRYRKLTDKKHQLDFRWFTGIFLNNGADRSSNYFSYGLSKPTDYLFEYNVYGRDEDTGFLYQQFIMAEGGFKTFFKENHQQYANDWMTTLNTSFSIWNWLEIYNDIGFLKSSYHSVFFGHESGIRFNFINDIFELYFPVYSNNGWEMQETDYFSRIRFSFVLQPAQIFNSARRGFL